MGKNRHKFKLIQITLVLNFFQEQTLTNHVSLFMHHSSQISEDVIHIQDIMLENKQTNKQLSQRQTKTHHWL